MSGFKSVPAKPRAVFHASAVVLSRVPRLAIIVWAAAAASLAAWLAPQTLVSWSWMRLAMMAGLRASPWPLLQRGSWAWKVNSVVARLLSPGSNFMVGTQSPKSRPAMVEATKPPKLPVTALVTAPEPTPGAVQRRVLPEPVQVPAAPVPEEPVEVDAFAAAAGVVATGAAGVAWVLLEKFGVGRRVDLQHG